MTCETARQNVSAQLERAHKHYRTRRIQHQISYDLVGQPTRQGALASSCHLLGSRDHPPVPDGFHNKEPFILLRILVLFWGSRLNESAVYGEPAWSQSSSCVLVQQREQMRPAFSTGERDA